MDLKFHSVVDKATSIDAGPLSYATGLVTTETSTEHFSAENGESFTIHYNYKYQYKHTEVWAYFAGFPISKQYDKEYWTATKFYSLSGYQSSPYPCPRIKSERDEYLTLQPSGEYGDKASYQFKDMQYTTSKFEIAAKLQFEAG